MLALCIALMRKSAFRISSLLLALYMLIPLSGIYVNLHRCGGSLVSIGLYTAAQVCQKGSSQNLDITQKSCHIDKKSCCSEQNIFKSVSLVKDNSYNIGSCNLYFELKTAKSKTIITHQNKVGDICWNAPPEGFLSPEQLQVFII